MCIDLQDQLIEILKIQLQHTHRVIGFAPDLSRRLPCMALFLGDLLGCRQDQNTNPHMAMPAPPGHFSILRVGW